MDRIKLTEYKKLAKTEFDNQSRKIKKPDGTLKGMQTFTQSMIDALKSLDKNVKTMANNFIKKHDLSDLDVKEMDKINRSPNNGRWWYWISSFSC